MWLLVSNRDRKDDLTSCVTCSSTVAGYLMEKPEGSAIAVSGGKVTAQVTSLEIQTVRVDYGHAKYRRAPRAKGSSLSTHIYVSRLQRSVLCWHDTWAYLPQRANALVGDPVRPRLLCRRTFSPWRNGVAKAGRPSSRAYTG